MASNQRIDDLRRRLEREPASRLFAQLAEELRKEGELEEAIQVCRRGLERHPSYPSAHMTLGRALLDTGDLEAARAEFEAALKGAPDNILASRMLGECLEGLGDARGALDRYQKTLLLAPGEQTIIGRVEELQARLAGGPPGAPAVAPAGAVPGPKPAPAPTGAEPEPIPLSQAEEEFELEKPYEGGVPRTTPQPPAVPAGAPTGKAVPEEAGLPAAGGAEALPAADEEEPAPIPVVAAEEAFELERPYEAPLPGQPPAGAAPPAQAPAGEVPPTEAPAAEVTPAEAPAVEAPPAEPPPAEAPSAEPPAAEAPPAEPPPTPEPEEAAADVEYDFESEREWPGTLPFRPLTAATSPSPPSEGPVGGVGEAPGGEALASVTLGELYLSQGAPEKALAVYRQLVEREPSNLRLRARLAEVEAAVSASTATGTKAEAPGGPPAVEVRHAEPPADPRERRRLALEHTIRRLEGMLAGLQATRKG